MVLNMMGQVLTANGRHEVALSTFQKAIRCARESGDVLLEAQATANTGLIRMWTKDVDRAVATFHEAVELFMRAGEEDEVGKITQIIADLEQRQPR
jgi:tetratricopeptide (TPR) repeat protein